MARKFVSAETFSQKGPTGSRGSVQEGLKVGSALDIHRHSESQEAQEIDYIEAEIIEEVETGTTGYEPGQYGESSESSYTDVDQTAFGQYQSLVSYNTASHFYNENNLDRYQMDQTEQTGLYNEARLESFKRKLLA